MRQCALCRETVELNATIRALLLASGLTLFIPTSAGAAEMKFLFDMPVQRADRALTAFAREVEASVLFPSEQARRVQANALRGIYSIDEGLEILLEGTGLVAVYNETGQLIVKTVDQAGEATPEVAELGSEESADARPEPSEQGGLLAFLSSIFAKSTEPPVEERAAPSGFAIEEVVVTARRVEEKLQDTPIAVSAFTGESLARRQVFDTDALDQVTPNLQFSNNAPLAGNNSSSQIFIRGIGQTDPTSTVDPGVGLYVDDVYMGQSLGGATAFRDIVGIQVLRGPQGTLFGRNTIGGAIVLTTAEPGDEFGGNFSARIGSDDLIDLVLAVDAPLSRGLRSRFSFATRQQDGYVIRVKTGEHLGDTDTYSLAGKLVWTPNDQLNVRIQYDYRTADENGNPLVFAASNESAVFQRVASADAKCPGFSGAWDTLPAVPLIDDERCANDFQNKGKFSNNGTFPIQSKLDTWGTSLRITYDLTNAATFKSITSYRELDWEGVRDADNTPLTILHTDFASSSHQLSEELQFLYMSDRFSGVLGLYYFQEEVDDRLTVFLNTPEPGEQKDSDNNVVQNHSWAVFSQWNYLLNDRLALTVGGRYTEDTKGSIPDQFNYADPSVKYLPVRLYEDTFTAFTVSGSLSYRWSDNAMTYISYAEGFKGGGWNSHFNRPQTAAELAMFHEFGPEQAETVEIGFKLDLFADTLRLNGAIFSTDYSDLQFTYRVGVAPYLANAGEASIEGLELEATWVPASSWIIEGAVGVLDGRVDKLAIIAGTATGVAVGNSLPYTPDWQANLGIGYIDRLNNGLTISPRFDVSMQDRTFFDANNTREIAQQDSVAVLNASATIQRPTGPWRLTIGVNNLSDEKYPVAGNSSLGTASGYAEIAYARRREYFVNFSYKF